MSELKPALKPYDLEIALFDDCGEECLVIDVGGGEHMPIMPSLKRVLDEVDTLLREGNTPAFAATKLYITGHWITTSLQVQSLDEADPVEIKQKYPGIVAEWQKATKKICTLLEHMGNLKELTWISGLPFTAVVFQKLPSALEKLVLDLGKPVRLDEDGDTVHKSYITSNDLQPLLDQVKLKELRLFRAHDSVQSIVWETVFRNTSDGGMRILDLQMAETPIVRSPVWKKARDVTSLTVPIEQASEQEYKGKDGKGILHYNIGTGEYLDEYCIRKARIASGSDEAVPLPLWGLKLDGFIVDSLPFKHELSDLVLLTCGENCIDAGLRAPKTVRAPRNKWSRAVNNATSHCLIKWPKWVGIFDDHGEQRNQMGVVVPQESAFSTSLDNIVLSPIMRLTAESLGLKELDYALVDAKSTSPPVLQLPLTQMPLETVSNKSERGSEVPTPTNLPSTAVASPLATVNDSAPITLATSPSDLGVVVVDGTEDTLSPTSTLSSFEHVSKPAAYDEEVSTEGSATPTVEANKTAKKSTFVHKVRRSFDWFSSSSL